MTMLDDMCLLPGLRPLDCEGYSTDDPSRESYADQDSRNARLPNVH
jgi:hypothetical protein